MENGKPIHLFVPTFRTDETLDLIKECLEIGWTGLGFKTVDFEKAWQEYTGLPHAHFINSATAGLHLAVTLLKRKYGWRDDDEIITTPLTFVSTNHAILYEKLKPVFADTDKYLCLDPDSVEKRITQKTRCIMFVGHAGNTGQLLKIVEICKARKLALILDAAHMSGTKWQNGQHVGKEADVVVFSYQAVKNLPTADSGMICFRSKELDDEVRKWTWLGINKDTYSRTHSKGTYKWMYDVEHVGFKYHGNSIMAAIGLVALKYLDEDNAYRRNICDWYSGYLDGSRNISIVPVAGDSVSSRHLFQVMVDNRDEVILKLNERNIYPGVHYRINTDYDMYLYAKGTCPNAESAASRVISLPLHLRMSRGDVKSVAEELKNICG